MRDIRTLNMTEGQKIESDDTIKKIGDFNYRNMGTLASMALIHEGKALIVGDGLRVTPSAGMTVTIPSGVVFQRSELDVFPAKQTADQTVTLDAASGVPRIDIIEAQVKPVADKTDTAQMGAIASGASGSTVTVTVEEIKRDMKYYLAVRKQTGTTTPTPATAGELAGTVAIAGTIDLSTKYLLYLADGEDGNFQEIDCRGAAPAATTRAEIIANINAAVGRTMAATGAGNTITLTGNGIGNGSAFSIKPPYTDSNKDALQIIFGVSAGGAYKYLYQGDNEWFKLAEIDVGAATVTITSGLIRNIDQKSTWSGSTGFGIGTKVPIFQDTGIKTKSITSSYHIKDKDLRYCSKFIIYADASGDNEIIVTAPTLTNCLGKIIQVIVTDSGAQQVILVGKSTSTIGGHARIYLKDKNDMIEVIGESSEWQVLNNRGTLDINWTTAQLVGSGLAIATVGTPALAALNGTDIAFIDDSNDELRTYRFNGSTWSLVGSGLAIATVGYPALAALNGTDIAFIDATNDSLRCYRFNGSTWSLVGSGLAIATVNDPALAALNDTDVAFIDIVNKDLRTYRFNGSTWSLVGSELNITGIGSYIALAALNGTDIAFIDSGNDELRTYRFNGSTWSLVGSGLNITGLTASLTLTALNGTDIAFIDATNDSLRCYRFNGSTWSLIGSGLAIATVTFPVLAALNGTDVAFIDATNDSLRCYRFSFEPK